MARNLVTPRVCRPRACSPDANPAPLRAPRRRLCDSFQSRIHHPGALGTIGGLMTILHKQFKAELQRSGAKGGHTYVVMPGSPSTSEPAVRQGFGARSMASRFAARSWLSATGRTNCRSRLRSARCSANRRATRSRYGSRSDWIRARSAASIDGWWRPPTRPAAATMCRTPLQGPLSVSDRFGNRAVAPDDVEDLQQTHGDNCATNGSHLTPARRKSTSAEHPHRRV